MANFMSPNNYLDPKTGRPRVGINRNWVYSEKYDGERAIYNGKTLVSKNNMPIKCPTWFTEMLEIAGTRLDGELYFGRGNWGKTGILRAKKLDEQAWKNIKYMIFDIPDADLMEYLPERLAKLQLIIRRIRSNWSHTWPCPFHVVDFIPYTGKPTLTSYFNQIVSAKGEGLILRNTISYYHYGKSDNILKYKPIQDCEVEIIDYVDGNGRNAGRLGSFKVRELLNPRIVFSVSGLTDNIRNNYKRTHPIGTVITVLYTERTVTGKPRFPRYKGIRVDNITSDGQIAQGKPIKSPRKIIRIRIKKPVT